MKFDNTAMKLPSVGTRVRLRQPVERFPDFLAHAGMTGTVKENNADMFSVRLDEPVAGAEEWDNCVEWIPSQETIIDAILQEIEVL